MLCLLLVTLLFFLFRSFFPLSLSLSLSLFLRVLLSSPFRVVNSNFMAAKAGYAASSYTAAASRVPERSSRATPSALAHRLLPSIGSPMDRANYCSTSQYFGYTVDVDIDLSIDTRTLNEKFEISKIRNVELWENLNAVAKLLRLSTLRSTTTKLKSTTRRSQIDT